jgi:hypothetical protein
MNAAQVIAYLAFQDEVQKLKKESPESEQTTPPRRNDKSISLKTTTLRMTNQIELRRRMNCRMHEAHNYHGTRNLKITQFIRMRMQGNDSGYRSVHICNAKVNEINITTWGKHQILWTRLRMKVRGGGQHKRYLPPSPQDTLKEKHTPCMCMMSHALQMTTATKNRRPNRPNTNTLAIITSGVKI